MNPQHDLDELERRYYRRPIIWLQNPRTNEVVAMYAGKIAEEVKRTLGWYEVDEPRGIDPHAGDVVLPPEMLGQQWPEDVGTEDLSK